MPDFSHITFYCRGGCSTEARCRPLWPPEREPAERLPSSGVTVPELLIGIALIAIVAAVSIPVVNGILQGYRLRAAAWQLAGDLRLARQKAVSTQTSHRISLNNSQASTDPNTYIIERQTGPSTWVKDLPSFGRFKLPFDIVIDPGGCCSSSPASISFNAKGNVLTTTVRLKNNAGGYEIKVEQTGRVQPCKCGTPCPPDTSLSCSWL